MRQKTTQHIIFFIMAFFASIGGLFAQADISLSLTQQPSTPQQFSFYTITATVTNTGPEAATNVAVSIPVGTGVVYQGGNEFTASAGVFLPYGSQSWTLPLLETGTSETLTINYFLTGTSAPDSYAQVTESDQSDPNSSPGNGTPPTVNEDDEATTLINGGFVPDLTLTNLVLTQNTVDSGAQIDFTFDINNIGAGSIAQNFLVQAYLSVDAIFSPDDLQNGTVPTGSFDPFQTVNGVQGASLPAGLAPGNYFLVLVADANGQVLESIETNNEISVPFTIRAVIPQVCAVTIDTATVVCNDSGTPQDPSDDTADLTVLASNAGGATYTVVSMAGDTVATGAYGTAATFSVLLFNAQNSPLSFVVQDDAEPMSCRDTFSVVTPSICSPDGPDLQLSNLVLDAAGVQPNGELNFTFDITNAGATAIAQNFLVQAFLSVDTILSVDDVQNGTVPTGSFDPMQTVSDVAGISNTSSLAPGDYYLILLADANRQVAETNEDNNTSVAVLFTVPEVVPQVCAVTIDTATVVCNDSGTPQDPSDDTADITVLASNAGGATYTVVSMAGDTVATGAYGTAATFSVLLFNAQNSPLSFVVQDDAEPMSCRDTFTVVTPSICSPDGPDLQLSNLVLDAAGVQPNGELSFTFDITNAGATAIAQNFLVQAFLSVDTILSVDDVQNGTVPTGSFDPMQTVSNVAGISNTSSLAPGDYYLILLADANRQVAETNEDNNTSVAVLFTVPEVVPQVCAVTIDTATVVCNDSGTPQDPSDDTADITVLASNAGGATYTVVSMAGDTVATGAYGTAATFSVLLFNAQNSPLSFVVQDDAEPMSCRDTFSVVTPSICSPDGPDLQLSNLVLDAAGVQPNGELNFTFDITNAGATAIAQNFLVQAFLSVDTILSVDDVQNGTVPTGSFDPMQTVSDVAGISNTSSLAPGDYYLILLADANRQVAETNEDNNTSVAVLFTVPEVVAPCNLELQGESSITCSDNNTPNDPSDDTAVLSFTATNGTNAGSFTVEDNLGTILTSGTYGAVTTLQIVDLLNIQGSTLFFTLRDDSTTTCSLLFSQLAPAPCSTPVTNEIDLSLTLAQNVAQPAQYTLFALTATVTNDGGSTATGVVVDVPRPRGLVYEGGNEFTASQGTFVAYGAVEGIWTVGALAPGASATITINYYVLVAVAPISYAEVLAANEQDVDSTPGNGNGQVNEDDEASTSTPTGPTCNITATVQSIDCDDQGTPIETDDTYSVTFLVENGGATGTWTADNGGTNPSFSGSYGVPYTLQGGNIFNTINLGGLTLSVNITDDVDATCSTTVTWQTPGATCSTSTDPCDAISEYQTTLADPICSSVSTSPEGIVKVIYTVGTGVDSFTFDGPAELGVTPVDNNTFLAGDVVCTSTGFAVVGTFRDTLNPASAQPFLFMLDGAGAVVQATIPPFASSYTDILDFNVVDVAASGAGGDILYVEVFSFSRSYQLAAFDANANLLWQDQRIGDLVTNRIGGSVLSPDESTIYFSYRDGNSQLWTRFRGVDALTGATQWEQQLALLVIPNPTGLVSGNVSKPLAMQNGDGALAFSTNERGSVSFHLAQFDPLGNNIYTTPLQSSMLSAPVYAAANDVVVLNNGNELLVYEGGNLVNCNGSASGVDLELAAVSAQSQPAIFDVNNVTFTLTNTGTETATGIAVDIPLPGGVVYTGGNEFTASQGSFNPYGNQVWTVGDLAAGATATIVINYYSLSATGYEQYAEVSMTNEQDIDSTPGNGTGTSAQEDDEVFLSLNAPVVMPLTFYPNPLPQGEQIILDFVSSGETTQTVLFSDLTGRPVQSVQVTFVEGRNQIPVDLGILPAGVYMVAFPKSGLAPKRIIVQE